MKYMIPLILIIFALVAVFVIPELSARKVYGPLLSDADLDHFMDTYLDAYVVNGYSYEANRKMFVDENDREMPYISEGGSSFLSKWSFEKELGRIPRWSKYSKILDERFEVLSKKLPQKKALKDY